MSRIIMNRFDLPPGIQMKEDAKGIHLRLPRQRMTPRKKTQFKLTLLVILAVVVIGPLAFAAARQEGKDLWERRLACVVFFAIIGGVAVAVAMSEFMQRETVDLAADQLTLRRIGGKHPGCFHRPYEFITGIVLRPVAGDASSEMDFVDPPCILEVACGRLPSLDIGFDSSREFLEPLGRFLAERTGTALEWKSAAFDITRRKQSSIPLELGAADPLPPLPPETRFRLATTAEALTLTCRPPKTNFLLKSPLFYLLMAAPTFTLLVIAVTWIVRGVWLDRLIFSAGFLLFVHLGFYLYLFQDANLRRVWRVTPDAFVTQVKGPFWFTTIREYPRRDIECIRFQDGSSSRALHLSLGIGLKQGSMHQLWESTDLRELYWLAAVIKNELQRLAAGDNDPQENQ